MVPPGFTLPCKELGIVEKKDLQLASSSDLCPKSHKWLQVSMSGTLMASRTGRMVPEAPLNICHGYCLSDESLVLMEIGQGSST